MLRSPAPFQGAGREEAHVNGYTDVAVRDQGTLFDMPEIPAKGFCYYGADFAGHLKIGWTARWPLQRRGGELGIHILWYFPGSKADEEAHQRRWKHLRITGEWFSPAADILLYLAGRLLATGAPPVQVAALLHLIRAWLADQNDGHKVPAA